MGRFRGRRAAACPELPAQQLASKAEMSGYLVGSAAFMGGVSRMTISLAVIIMEMSNEVGGDTGQIPQ